MLRFFALLHRRDRYRTPFRVFLNDEMASNQHLEMFSLERCHREFDSALTWTQRIFAEEAFKKFQTGNPDNQSGRWINRRYDLIYEVETVGFGMYGDRLEEIWNDLEQQQKDFLRASLRSRLAEVMAQERFGDTLSDQTTAPRVVRTRFDMWTETLEAVMSNPQRAIERAMQAHRLLSASNICAICPQPINTPDDAVIVEREGDLRMAHRFCNRRP